MGKFPGQGLNPSHSCDLHLSGSNTGSFNLLGQVRGSNPRLCSNLSCCSRILNCLRHNKNSSTTLPFIEIICGRFLVTQRVRDPALSLLCLRMLLSGVWSPAWEHLYAVAKTKKKIIYNFMITRSSCCLSNSLCDADLMLLTTFLSNYKSLCLGLSHMLPSLHQLILLLLNAAYFHVTYLASTYPIEIHTLC